MDTSAKELSTNGKDLIMQSYVHLLSKTNGGRITVTDICRKAGVNRSTFYSYFVDVDELFHTVARAFFNSVFGDVYANYEEEKSLRKALIIAFQASLKNREISYIFLNHVEYSFMLDVLTDRSWEILQEQGMVDDMMLMRYTYFSSGIISIWRKWLNDGCTASIEDVADLIVELMHSTLDPFWQSHPSEGKKE